MEAMNDKTIDKEYNRQRRVQDKDINSTGSGGWKESMTLAL